MQIHPPYLEKGDLVGITAPARWISPGDTEFFLKLLHDAGFRAVTGPIYKRYNQFAGTDGERLKDLQSMLDHPDIRAIFCARGGYGSMRLLKGIDLEAFAARPKWLVGYSDITALHCLLQIKIGCESLHAPMPWSFKECPVKSDPGSAGLFGALTGEMPDYRVESHALNRNGTGEGILLGGNLSVLYSLTGTPYQLDTGGGILFLEDVDEYLYHIDRMMQNLKLSGMLSGLQGLVVGGMTDMHDNEVPFGRDAYSIIRDAVNQYDYPVLFGFPAGHLDTNLALVLGRRSRLTVDDRGGRLQGLDPGET